MNDHDYHFFLICLSTCLANGILVVFIIQEEKVKHSEQRVGVFIDVANMYHSARFEYNSRVNFGKVLEVAVAGRKLVRAIAYAARTDEEDEQGFFDALNKIGIEVFTKELQTFVDGTKKGNVDMELAIDALKLAPKLDTIVVVSGDGDYKILLEHLRALGCRVEVIGFARSVSSRLLEVAHDFINLEDNVGAYLFKIRDKKKTKPASSNKSATQSSSTSRPRSNVKSSRSSSQKQSSKTVTQSVSPVVGQPGAQVVRNTGSKNLRDDDFASLAKTIPNN